MRKVLDAVNPFINDWVRCITRTRDLDVAVIAAAIIPPQHRAVKKNPTSQRRSQSAHARSNLDIDMRKVPVGMVDNTDMRTSKV